MIKSEDSEYTDKYYNDRPGLLSLPMHTEADTVHHLQIC